MHEHTSSRGSVSAALVLCALAVTLVLAGCSGNSDAGDESEGSDSAAATTDSCVACHTDSGSLADAGLPDEMEAEAFLVSQKFLDSDHAGEGCVTCHGGDSAAEDKEMAHAEFNPDPSIDAASCGGSDCHDDIAETFEGSLHDSAQGILAKLAVRLSNTPGGDTLAHDVFYAEEGCGSCHATCGQCHISQPNLFGGGLLDGHVFVDATKQKHNDVTCAQCHDAIGPQYVESDLHHEYGKSCADCNSNPEEVHGDGQPHTGIADGTITVTCEECHEDLTLPAHTPAHLDGATCSACHAAPYMSCQGCHDDEPGTIDEKVTLARGADGRIATFAHTPISEEMLGEPFLDMEQLNTKASWIEGTPHTVQKAEMTQDLCDRCHGPGEALLISSELQFPDHENGFLLEPLPPVTP